MIDLHPLIQPCIDLAKNAGDQILRIYRSKANFNIEMKSDATPVTRADLEAHEIIVKELNLLTPNIPVLSEEAANISFNERQQWETYWLIDPLDGTKEFINGTDEFTVNIALVHEGHSILGVIYAPVLDVCYYAYSGAGAFKIEAQQQPISIKTCHVNPDNLRVAVSRRHSVGLADNFMNKIPHHTKIPKGSSLKTCLIAEGQADIYPCLGHTSEWDMGAAQCIIEQAGGAMVDLTFQSIKFNQKDSLLNPPLLVMGDKDYNWQQYI